VADVEEKPELAAEDVENADAEENPSAPSPPIPREPEPEAPEPDCPKCVSGAPAWMATFADMATLLMAFFVLILSFAEMNVPKFKDVSGSMNDSFGVQRSVPVVEPPLSDSVIAKQFSQAKVEATALNTIQEQTTNDPQPEDPELRTTTSPSDSELSSDLERVQAALKDEIARGAVEVVRQDDKISVVVNSASTEGLESGQDGNGSGRKLSQDTVSLYAKVAEAQTSVVTEIQVVDKSPAQDSQVADASSSIPQEPQVEAGNSELEQIRARLAP
jgi:chemotaxis protein MotB